MHKKLVNRGFAFFDNTLHFLDELCGCYLLKIYLIMCRVVELHYLKQQPSYVDDNMQSCSTCAHPLIFD
jgi:hypothetical protein